MTHRPTSPTRLAGLYPPSAVIAAAPGEIVLRAERSAGERPRRERLLHRLAAHRPDLHAEVEADTGRATA